MNYKILPPRTGVGIAVINSQNKVFTLSLNTKSCYKFGTSADMKFVTNCIGTKVLGKKLNTKQMKKFHQRMQR